jgi:4-amino-4-deoxy-L-arabinose transferase-like glycosyltransferase
MSSTRSLTQQFFFLLLGVTVLRLLWHLIFNPIGITGDEAYNWDWGRHLSWGYYSKPPGSAWLHGLVGFLTNDSLFAIKATATLLAGGSTLFFFLTLKHLFKEQFAFWVSAVYLLCPGQLMVSSILTADAQLLLYWNLSLFATVHILFPKEASKPHPGYFALLFFAMALGHLAKQMMLIQFPLLILAVIFIRPSLFKNPLLYLAPLASLVSLLPPLYWNSQNDWITIEHTAHHFDEKKFDILDILERFGALLGLSAILLTPLAVAAIPRSLKLWFKEKRGLDSKTVFLILYGTLPFAVMFLMTLRQEVNPNWPAVYHGGTLALAGIFYAFRPGNDGLTKAWQTTLRLTVALTSVIFIGFIFAEFLFANTPLKAQRRTYWGYPELSAKIASHNPEGDHAIILRGHRDGASEFAFNMPGKPEVHVWNERDTIAHQYDFWAGPEVGTPALLIIEQRRKGKDVEITDRMRESFEEFEFLGEYELHPSRGGYPRFLVYRTSPIKSWPSPVEGSRQ